MFFQGELFPWMEDTVGPLSERHRHLVMVLEMAPIERLLPYPRGGRGRPLEERAALARAFVAKAVFNVVTTRLLIDRLSVDRTLRQLCGWQRAGKVPSESTFSRAFAEFAESELAERLHAAVIAATQDDRLIGHISRDSTDIEAREKAAPKVEVVKPKRRRGRPRKGEERPPAAPSERRLERQADMSLAAMLADLPRHCAVGAKRNATGYTGIWRGYKLHLDVADGDIPISALLTSATVHDSQVAIPLATITAGRVCSLYDLMDSAYDAPEIKAHSRSLGHVPIVETSPRGSAAKQALDAEKKRRRHAGRQPAEAIRYRERGAVERVNGRLKDHFGGRTVGVRGHDKVFCHLMFGVLAITVEQVMRLVT